MNALVPNVRKIAVLRANALGDFIFALPALDALRAAYPDAEITLLGRDWHAGYLTGRPSPIDRVVVVPPYPGVSVEAGTPFDRDVVDRFLWEMQGVGFDLAIQLHGGGGHSNPLVDRLGARLTAGTRDLRYHAPPLDRWIPYIYFQPEFLRWLEVVALVGARPVRLDPCVAVTDADRAESEAVLPGGDLAVLHPGVSSVDRQWPEEKFAAVGDALAAEGLRVVVTGTAGEVGVVRRTVGAMNAPAVDLCGRLTLGGLTGLLSRARVVVANDTGPLHLAEATGTPTVGIYWCFNLINGAPATRTLHRQTVSWRLDCPLCGRSQISDPCTHAVSYVADIPVEDVLIQARELLALERPQPVPSAS